MGVGVINSIAALSPHRKTGHPSIPPTPPDNNQLSTLQCTAVPTFSLVHNPQPLNRLLEAWHVGHTEVTSVIALIGKAVEGLLEGRIPGIQTKPEILARFRDTNIFVLRAIAHKHPRPQGHCRGHCTNILVLRAIAYLQDQLDETIEGSRLRRG